MSERALEIAENELKDTLRRQARMSERLTEMTEEFQKILDDHHHTIQENWFSREKLLRDIECLRDALILITKIRPQEDGKELDLAQQIALTALSVQARGDS